MSMAFKGRLPRLALGLLVTLVMAAGLVYGLRPSEAFADVIVEYPLWVGETQVTSKNCDDVLNNHWSFAPAKGGTPATLTLNGYDYEGVGHGVVLQDEDGGYDYYRHSSIFWNDDSTLVIKLEGDNNATISADLADENPTDDDESRLYHRYCGVFSAGSLTFQGTGRLTADASDITSGDAGIYACRNITVESGSISAVGSENGIYSHGGRIAIGVSAGTIVAEATGEIDSALYGIGAEGGDVKIDGGTVTARGYRGIGANNNIVINGGEVDAKSTVPSSAGTSILNPSAIVSKYGTVTINDGTVIASGHMFGIYSDYVIDTNDDKHEDGMASGILINGGSVIATANESGGSGIAINGGVMTVAGGSVQAIGGGDKGYGVSSCNTLYKSVSGTVLIEEGVVSFSASGTAGAMNDGANVKNAIGGIGWKDAADTESKVAIKIDASGQSLNGFKKVSFPAVTASIVTPPSGKSLVYNGQPQELVTAGVAYGGEIQYSLDGKSYSAQLPTATDAGTYTVYYKVVGDAEHMDTEAMTVTVVISEPEGGSDTPGPGGEADYPAPKMENSRGGTFTSTSEEITYTILQDVPGHASKLRTWVDLESVMQYTVGEDGVTVTTSDGAAVAGAKVTIEGQRLTVTVEDAAPLRGKTLKISYKAKVKSGANLSSYANAAGNIASVPYQAHTVFDGREDDVKSSEVERVNFRISASSTSTTGGTSSTTTSGTGSTTTSAKSNTLSKTGDATSFVAATMTALAGASALVAGRRKER